MECRNIKYYPELKDIDIGIVKLRYSNHALYRMRQRGIRPLKEIDIKKGTVVETYHELNTGRINKITVRIRYNKEYDKVYVLNYSGREYLFVITCWLNHINDNHATLKLKK